jgi:hypothetical protein
MGPGDDGWSNDLLCKAHAIYRVTSRDRTTADKRHLRLSRTTLQCSIKLFGVSYKLYIVLRIGSINIDDCIYFCDVMSCSAFTILGPNG